MMRLSKLIGISFLVVAVTAISFAQTNPNNVREPPAAELKKFEPFLGKYNMTADYAGLKWSGTLEIKPAIKGWYVERIILIKSDDGSIDREFRTFITYDANQKSYRGWGFETLPPLLTTERSIRFEGNDFVEEIELEARDGSKLIHRTRYMMTNKDELRIITERQDTTGKTSPFGMVIAKRTK